MVQPYFFELVVHLIFNKNQKNSIRGHSKMTSGFEGDGGKGVVGNQSLKWGGAYCHM